MNRTQTLDIYIGKNTKVGTLSLPVGTETEFSFRYEEKWKQVGFPISPYIPFDDSAPSRSIENYLRNLLPEGDSLQQLCESTTISRNNTFGLVRAMGAETSGALSFRDSGAKPIKTSFRLVPEDELARRLEHSMDPLVFWDGKIRLSVAGVQSKLNLLRNNDEWGFGEGDLCSNYILKFENGRAPCIAVNEFFCMTLAERIGMDVANVELLRFGNTRTLAIERFDRAFFQDRTTVARKHVIDGCQATNLPPSYKYERQNGDDGDGKYMRDGVSFPRLAAIETSNRVETNFRLTQWMLFNLATLNYDAHGKNISYFVTTSGLSLTPFYDLVNIEAIAQEGTRRNEQSTRSSSSDARENSQPQYFAMSIGDWESETFQDPPIGNFQHPITSYDLAEYGALIGYSPLRMASYTRDTAQAILDALEDALAHTVNQGIDKNEIRHIELCKELTREQCKCLIEIAEDIPGMSELL